MKVTNGAINAVLFIVVIILCLLAGEALIRTFNLQTGAPGWPQENARFVPELKKNVYPHLQNLTKSTSEYNYQISTNDNGFRDVHDFEKKKGVYRVVGIGSSAMFGNTVNVDKTYLSVLGEKLNAETINLGLGGSGFGEIKFILQEYGLQYDPDLLIIDASQGSFYASYLFEKKSVQPGKKSLYLKAYEQSKLLSFLYWRIKTTPLGFSMINFFGLNRHAQNSNAFDIDLLSNKNTEAVTISKKAVFKNIQEIKEIADDNNVPVVFIFIPAPHHLNQDQLDKIIQEYNLDPTTFDISVPPQFYKAVAEKLSIPFFDPTEALKMHPDSKNLQWKYDGHFNENGNAIYAALLAEFLRDNNIVDNKEQNS
ncbi:MAG: SGNH/GDSL hydrolase family protein [Nanoarchaeota archaeon]|nr:SGNH/GDSL hydrolase family protein [Nanoarchaeota archaeon]